MSFTAKTFAMSQENNELTGLSVSLSAIDDPEERERLVRYARLGNDDQQFLIWSLMILSICTMIWLWFCESATKYVGGIVENPTKELRYLVDLNNAPKNELLQLPGIGETLTNRIIEYRENVAIFKDVADLEKIQGIGVKKREAATPYVYIR